MFKSKVYSRVRFFILLSLVILAQAIKAQTTGIYSPYVYAPYDSAAKGILLKEIRSGKVVNPIPFEQVDRLDDRNKGLYYGFLCHKGGKKYLYGNDGISLMTEPFDEFIPAPAQSPMPLLIIIRKDKSYYLLTFDKGLLANFGAFEEYTPLFQGLTVRKQNKYYRIVNGAELKISPAYDQIKTVYFPTHPTHFVATQGGKWGIANAEGATLIPFAYDSIYISNYVHLLQKGKWGLATLDYHMLIPCLYDQVYSEWNPNVFHMIQNGKHGLLDSALKEVVPPLYDNLYPAYENKSSGATWSPKHYFAKYQGKWGLLNEQNKWRIPNLYDSIVEARSHYIYVMLDKKMSVIDSKGNLLFPFKYAQVLRSDHDFRFAATKPFYFVSNDTNKRFHKGNIHWGLADEKGNLLQDMTHAKVRLHSTYEFRNPEQSSYFYENIDSTFVAYVWNKGGELKYQTYGGDSTNQEVFDKNGNSYYVKVLNTTKTAYLRGGKYGLMNAKGIMILPQEYDELVFRFEDKSYSEKIKAASLSDPLQLPVIGYDEDYWINKKDPLLARKGKVWGVISMNGKIILPFVYDSIAWHEEEVPWEAKTNEAEGQEEKVLLFELRRNKLIGFATTKGLIVTPPQLGEEWQNFLVRKTIVPQLSEEDYGYSRDAETRAYTLENATRRASKHLYLKAYTQQSPKKHYQVKVPIPAVSTLSETDSVRYNGGFDFPQGGPYTLLNGVTFQQNCPWAEDILLIDKNKTPVQLSDFGSYLRCIGWHQYSEYKQEGDSLVHRNPGTYSAAEGPWFHLCFIKLKGQWFLYDLMRKTLLHPEAGFDAVQGIDKDGYTVLKNNKVKTFRFDYNGTF
jgi:hypothetical protein